MSSPPCKDRKKTICWDQLSYLRGSDPPREYRTLLFKFKFFTEEIEITNIDERKFWTLYSCLIAIKMIADKITKISTMSAYELGKNSKNLDEWKFFDSF